MTKFRAAIIAVIAVVATLAFGAVSAYAASRGVHPVWHTGPVSWLHWRYAGTVDGHHHCVYIVGRDTGVYSCKDGYATTS